MNALKSYASKAFAMGIKARTFWLTLLVGILIGWLMAVAWAYTLRFATPQALALIAWVQG